MAIEIIHESQGLQIRKNSSNRFTVVRLHYSADPAKRSDAWKAEASAGMHPDKWRQEYEIEYDAMSGAKVFPELHANRDKIVVHSPYPEVPRNNRCWMGMDYGQRNPTSVHCYTILDGVVYSVWEHYEPCRSIPELVKTIKSCPYWEQVKYIAYDPSMDQVRMTNKFGAPCSVIALLQAEGLNRFLRGNYDEAAWLAAMRKHWIDSDNPTFRIFDTCPCQIRELEEAHFENQTSRNPLNSTLREEIADYNNHAMDDLKYFMNSQPRELAKRIVLPSLIKHWTVKY